MENKAYNVLEYDKILAKLAGYTDSETVKERIKGLAPYKELDEAKRAQRETTEAVSAALKLGNPGVNLAVANIVGSVRRADSGGVLNLTELLAAARTLNAARRMKSYLGEVSEQSKILRGHGAALQADRALEDKIGAAILSDTEIADDASADLAAIRRKKRNLNAKIKDTLNDMVRSAHYKKFLQDPIVTMRADRYVIPVRAEYRAEVQGIVHDSSASGATLFVEPISVVNANNEIRELENKEQREIERILAALSAEVAADAELLISDYNIIAELDFIFCKAKLSLDYNGNEPELNNEGIIELKRARHPLIAKDRVVANDICLGEKFDTLVITGPNTGGKTVTLKTIGLFSLMAAAGLHLPVTDGSRAAVFERIFADIGDEQSIEQSLSTFSSHMVNIVNIVGQVDSASLVLFDELGAGTDPTEGAALAISILEHLRMFGARTAATTHYSELKLFALSTGGVENASCEFDVESLKPTYRLLIGVPGKSNAFAISKRLGLDERIIDRANDILSDEDVKFEDVITELEQNRVRTQSEMEYASRMKTELGDLKKEIEDERRKLKENKARILDDARREAKLLVVNAREEANKIIRELERMRIEGVKSAELEEKAAASREKLQKREKSIDKAMRYADKPKKSYREPPKNLKEGETVKILSMGENATVLKTPAPKDQTVRVQAGIIKMDVHITDLERVKDNSAQELADRYVKSTNAFSSKTKNAVTEVDVRGQMLEEAVMNVEKFLDDCYLAGISPVTIIHGKGTGVLRKGIGEMLKKHKYVKSYRPGRYGEGEMGVTIVELK